MGKFQNFMMKQMLKSKLKGVPEAEREQITGLVEAHPDFFKRISEEVERRKKSGQGEMEATMAVMRENQAELQRLMRS